MTSAEPRSGRRPPSSAASARTDRRRHRRRMPGRSCWRCCCPAPRGRRLTWSGNRKNLRTPRSARQRHSRSWSRSDLCTCRPVDHLGLPARARLGRDHRHRHRSALREGSSARRAASIPPSSPRQWSPLAVALVLLVPIAIGLSGGRRRRVGGHDLAQAMPSKRHSRARLGRARSRLRDRHWPTGGSPIWRQPRARNSAASVRRGLLARTHQGHRHRRCSIARSSSPSR